MVAGQRPYVHPLDLVEPDLPDLGTESAAALDPHHPVDRVDDDGLARVEKEQGTADQTEEQPEEEAGDAVAVIAAAPRTRTEADGEHESDRETDPRRQGLAPSTTLGPPHLRALSH
jgi:hypothetical protein